MSARDRSRIERISRPWKLDIMSHIRRFNLKDTRGADREPERPSVFGPRRAHGLESLRPNWVTFEGKITIPPSASMYRFQSVVFFCACFARSTAIVATTLRTTSSTSRPSDEAVRTARPAPGESGWGKRFAHEDRGDAGTGSRDGQAAPCDHQGQCASPLAEDLVRDARVCQGRRGRLLLPARAEVQNEVRDPRLQRRGEPRRRRPVGGRLRTEGVDPNRRGKDQRAREESHPLRTETYRRSIATNVSWGGFIVRS